MSNYRVRQVLALGALPDRRLRLLLALATFMDDDSRSVKAGFAALITVSGRTHNTIRAARRELEKDGQLASEPGCGRGRLTVWTVLCLPEKGTNVLGTEPGPERVPTEAEKGYQSERADQRQPEHGLNRRAKSSSARVSSIVRAVYPDATEDEIETIKRTVKAEHNPANVGGYIAAMAENGDLRLPCGPERTEWPGSRTKFCHGEGNDRDCPQPPPSWCRCRCHVKPLRAVS